VNISIPIYRWSKSDTFPKNPFNISIQTEDNTNAHNITLWGLHCVALMNMKDKHVAKEIIDRLPNTTLCVLVSIEEAAELIEWVIGSNHYIDSPFPVGIIISSPEFLLSESFQFLGWNENENIPFFWVSVVVHSLLLLFDILCVMMGFYRLYEKYTLDQLIVNISTVCIGLEIINCLLWVIHAILEILLRVVPFLNVKSDSDAMVGYISFPFSLASGILVIFFWIELTSKKLYRKSFLDKSFWPAVIFIAIAFILLSISAILFLTDIDHKIIKNLTLAILVFILIISCTYFYAAYRTYNYSKKKETKNQSLFKEMSIKIIISGIVMIFIVFLSFSVSVISSTAGRIIFGYLTFILILVRSYLLIDIFSSRKSKNNSSRTNTDANSSNANVNSTE
jgi:hypothetical protein